MPPSAFTPAMATLTPAYPSRTTGPETNRRALWEFAVPLDGDQNYIQPNESMTAYGNQHPQLVRHRSSRSPLSSHANGNTIRPKASDSALAHDSFDGGSPDPYKLYANPAVQAKKVARKKSSLATTATKTPQEDESDWIHRDKLAAIESREMEEFLVSRVSDRPLAPGASATAGADQSPDKLHMAEDLEHLDKRQRLASPVSVDEAFDDQSYNWDTLSSSPKSNKLKPASRAMSATAKTRIPIPSSLSGSGPAVDLPAGAIACAARSRSNSIGLSHSLEQCPIAPRLKRRLNGSQDIDNNEDFLSSSPDSPPRGLRNPSSAHNQSSPPAKKSPSANGKTQSRRTSTHRNTSAQKTLPRTTPTPVSTATRPGTSSGRPGTSHRLEGDPPWLATMYKPDPRLPPDQQMLPTLAKRLAQEQWEREGKTGTVYDRNFQLLNDHAFPEKPPSHKSASPLPSPIASPALAPPSMDDFRHGGLSLSMRSNGKLLERPLGSPRSATSSPRPGTSDTHGGYKVMPTISRAATPYGHQHQHQLQNQQQNGGSEKHSLAQQPAIGTVSVQPGVPAAPLAHDDDDEKLKKGCACCIVM